MLNPEGSHSNQKGEAQLTVNDLSNSQGRYNGINSYETHGQSDSHLSETCHIPLQGGLPSENNGGPTHQDESKAVWVEVKSN